MARSPMSCFVAHCTAPDVATYGGDQVKRREFLKLLGARVAAASQPNPDLKPV
jgi:hypothetical protein